MNSQHISTPFTCAAWCQDAIVQHVIPANLCCPTVKYVLLFCGQRMPFYQTFSVMYYLVNTFASVWGNILPLKRLQRIQKSNPHGQRKPKGKCFFLRAPGAKRRWHGSTTSLRNVGSLCPHGSPVDRTTEDPSRAAKIDKHIWIEYVYICVCVCIMYDWININCSNCLCYIYVPPTVPLQGNLAHPDPRKYVFTF